MKNLSSFILKNKENLSSIIALDVRQYDAISTSQAFLQLRDATATAFGALLKKSSSCWLARHDHDCEESDFICSSPEMLFNTILNQPQSTRCSCSSLSPSLFDHSFKLLNAVSSPKILIVINCGRSSSISNFVAKSKNLINTGWIVACLNIGGDPNLSGTASPGYYEYFSDVSNYVTNINKMELNLPEEKPTIEKRRIGCRSIEIEMKHKKDDPEYFVMVMDAEATSGSSWINVGSTLNNIFQITSTPNLEIKPCNKYRVRVAAKINGVLSDYAEPEKSAIYPYRTLMENPWVPKLFVPSSELEETIKELKKELGKPISQEAESLGIKHYKFIVFGDIGAGKSSFLNTIATAYSNDKAYIGDFQVGRNDVNSTTKALWGRKLADSLMGADIPGINGSNYADPAKVTALIEGRLGQNDWIDHLEMEFNPKNMVHIVFFVVPLDALSLASVQERYKTLKKNFTEYKKYGVEGLHPYLIITKADDFDLSYKSDTRKIYDDDTITELQNTFCQKTNIHPDYSYLVSNYVPGSYYKKTPYIDFVVLNIVEQAIHAAQSIIRRVAMFYEGKPGICGVKVETVKVGEVWECENKHTRPDEKTVFCGSCGTKFKKVETVNIGEVWECENKHTRPDEKTVFCGSCGTKFKKVETVKVDEVKNNWICPSGHTRPSDDNNIFCGLCGGKFSTIIVCLNGHPKLANSTAKFCGECGASYPS
eukprot:TRINITY_DN94_c0_g1_i1.p1 TRINITY_DN94_c0_g1~~TRINITY_DN94_c0_g1_i1.p1  ORF type:complete len:709 (-),score=127.28 TRINITY_DN94_c0_g1_i1:59-2185(-)